MRLLFFLLVFFFSKATYSQLYNQMLDNDAEWQLTSCYYGCNTDAYFTDGDTSYNGYNYTVLNGFHYISRTFWLREDVQNKKVYMSYLGNNQRVEVLLYDFSIAKGDTINLINPISPFPTYAGDFIVDSVVIFPLQNNQSYKYFFLSSISGTVYEFPVWIEGIGSLSMINAPGGTPDVNGAGKLSCYFESGNLFYSQLDSIRSCILVNNPILSQDFFRNTNTKKKIIAKTDIFGRNVNMINNKLYFIIYDDGTVEKRIIIQ